MRRAVGRASPAAVATSVSDMLARPGWNTLMTSRPRASASMKSGPVSARAMGGIHLLGCLRGGGVPAVAPAANRLIISAGDRQSDSCPSRLVLAADHPEDGDGDCVAE